MRTYDLLTIVVLLSAVVSAEVSVSVYRPDGRTPLGPVEPNLIKVYPDIMVGTRLALVVHSDTPGYWWGGLLLTWNNWVVGNVSARGESSGLPELSYEESVLPAAGTAALVQDCIEPSLVGFELVSWVDAVAGDWFVLEYHAEQIGLCYLGLYDYGFSLSIPIEILLFSHVRSGTAAEVTDGQNAFKRRANDLKALLPELQSLAEKYQTMLMELYNVTVSSAPAMAAKASPDYDPVTNEST